MNEFDGIEDKILSQVGLFIKEATKSTLTPDGIKVFLLDRDWPRITEEYVGVQVTNIKRNGRAFYETPSDVNGRTIAINWYEVLVEIIGFRGRPTSRLMQLTHALEHQYLKREFLLDKGIGVSQVSSVSKADTVLDGVKKELRARMTLVLNIGVSDADPILPGIAENIFINLRTVNEFQEQPVDVPEDVSLNNP